MVWWGGDLTGVREDGWQGTEVVGDADLRFRSGEMIKFGDEGEMGLGIEPALRWQLA